MSIIRKKKNTNFEEENLTKRKKNKLGIGVNRQW